MSTYEEPYTEIAEDGVIAVAAGSDLVSPLHKVVNGGAVSKVEYSPITDIVGADTNTRTVSLINRKGDGSGTTVIATFTFNAASGTTTHDTPKAITLTAANAAVAPGDELVWSSAHVGTGLADPGGLVHVEITRTSAG